MNELRHRWTDHKRAYGHWLKNDCDRVVSIYPYFQEHGIEHFKMILVKEYEVEDRKHLKLYEQLYINKFRKTCVNKSDPFIIPRLSEKQYQKKYLAANREKRVETVKKYYDANKEVLNAKGKQHRDANKEIISEKRKEYRKENKEKFHERGQAYYAANKEQSKQYYEANKEKIKARASITITCTCGLDIPKGRKARHIKTSKHLLLMEQQAAVQVIEPQPAN